MSRNRQYVESLKKQVEHVARELAAETASLFYISVVRSTAADSGQAVAHWQIWHDESEVPMAPTIMWGYGDIAPTGIVGYKGSGDGEFLIEELVSWHLGYADLFGPSGTPATTFTVHNPIEPGAFMDFAPGNDLGYAQNALGLVDLTYPDLLQEAARQAEQNMAAKYNFLRVV